MLKRKMEQLETICYDRKEVKSWWLVDKATGKKLKKLHEPMVKSHGLCLWGCSKRNGIKRLAKMLKRR